MGARLEIQSLSKSYGQSIAVEGVSLNVAPGEFVSLLGASGSGKTTTLMMVAGFTAPDRGTILLDGRTITGQPPERRGIGVVFQNYALFPHMSVARNVGFPLRMRGIPRSETARRIDDVLKRVGLAGFQKRLPSQLSGGQQQRVALARALIFEPGLLLMDEPLGALDRALRETMKAEIRRLQRELGITVVYITHDQEEALTLSDRIVLMNGGRIVQIGSPRELYEEPASSFVASFLGESTLVSGEVVTDGAGVALLPADGGPPLPARTKTVGIGDKAMLLLRPEKLHLADPQSEGGMAATIEDIVYIGDAHGDAFTLPDDAVVGLLASTNPRGIRRLVGLALGFAAQAGRRHLIVAEGVPQSPGPGADRARSQIARHRHALHDREHRCARWRQTHATGTGVCERTQIP